MQNFRSSRRQDAEEEIWQGSFSRPDNDLEKTDRVSEYQDRLIGWITANHGRFRSGRHTDGYAKHAAFDGFSASGGQF